MQAGKKYTVVETGDSRPRKSGRVQASMLGGKTMRYPKIVAELIWVVAVLPAIAGAQVVLTVNSFTS